MFRKSQLPLSILEVRLVDFQPWSIFYSTLRSCQFVYFLRIFVFLQQLVNDVCKMVLACVAVHDGIPALTNLYGLHNPAFISVLFGTYDLALIPTYHMVVALISTYHMVVFHFFLAFLVINVCLVHLT